MDIEDVDALLVEVVTGIVWLYDGKNADVLVLLIPAEIKCPDVIDVAVVDVDGAMDEAADADIPPRGDRDDEEENDEIEEGGRVLKVARSR